MKIPKTFMPEKDLEGRTEELLEDKEIKPKLDPKITLVDEVLGELDYNLKYYESNTFHSNVYIAIHQKGYEMLGGLRNISNAYFVKREEPGKINVLVRVFEKKNMHYYLATTKSESLEEFVDRFDNYKDPLSQNSIFSGSMNVFNLTYFSSAVSYLAYLFSTKVFNTPYNSHHSLCSITAGLGISFVTTWLLKRRKFKKNEKQLNLLCEELILDEKEAIKKALR